MLKKWTALFLATVLALALCPAVAIAETENNWDMETWTEPAAPDGFTITPGEGAVVSCDETDILGNNSKKIKISHPEGTATAETETTVEITVTQEANDAMSAAYYISFWLESLAEGSDGVKLWASHKGWITQETEYFKDTTYQKWRKMMTYSTGVVRPESSFKVTFKGVGTLYLDNLEAEFTKMIINGGFEGLIGDGKLCGYKYADTTSTGYTTQLWSTTTLTTVKPSETVPLPQFDTENDKYKDGGWYFVETVDNNYIQSVNNVKGMEFQSVAGLDRLTAGKTYRTILSNKYSGNMTGCKFATWTGYGLPYASTTTSRGIFASPTLDWADKSAVFVYQFGASQNRTSIGFSGYNFTTNDANKVPSSYFDNVRVEEVTESVAFKIETGENDKKIATASYETPLLDVSKDVFDEAKMDGYQTKNSISLMAGLYRKEGNAYVLENVEFVEGLSGKTDKGADWANSGPETTEVGFRPAQHDFTFEIPDAEEYIVKVFAWDGFGNMKPFSGKSYSFDVASE